MSTEKVYDASNDAKMEERSTVETVRDNTESIKTSNGNVGRIESYKFKILVRDKPTLEGELTRDEMNILYRDYSSEGSNLTQRQISRSFQNYTFQEFKKILRAFNITKASAPLAPHILEEKTIEDQLILHQQYAENRFLKKIEQTREKQTEKRAKDIANEYYTYKSEVESFNIFLSSLHIKGHVEVSVPSITTDKAIIVYLSDMHIGADVSKHSIYANKFNYEEAQNRMTLIIKRIKELAFFTMSTNIIICNIGDSLDGYNNTTTRGGHFLPQNMNNKEQFANYIQIMMDLFSTLSSCGLFKTIKYYCVPGGNHDGDFGYVTNKALEGYLYKLNPNIETIVFDKFIDSFKYNNHTFVLCHGKDEKDMFRNLPLTLEAKTENKINEFLEYSDLKGNVHFVKGDLHQTATTYGKRFRYKSVCSFFGSSEWIHKNMGNTKAGCDIDILDGDNILETHLILN